MKPGDILYFWGEETALMVTMENEKGIRYYDINSPDFTDEGSIITRFVSYVEIYEVCSYVGNLEEMVRSKVTQLQVDNSGTVSVG